MSILRLSEKLYGPYDVMCRFLEQLPDGLTYDVLQAKVPALRRLKSKDLDALLEYTNEKDRVLVIRTERKGASAAPLLRHKKFGVPTVVKEPEPVKSENTVYVSTAGKSELQKPEVKKVETVETAAPEPVADTAKDAKLLRMKYLDVGMHTAATDIMAHLRTQFQGVTRTELGNAVMSYHRLRGANRQVVLSYLVANEGVREVQPAEGSYRTAAKFVHPVFVQNLDKSEKPYDHTAPDLTLDSITPLADPVEKPAHAVNDAPVTPAPTVDQSEIVSLTNVANEIVAILESMNEHLPMYELHKLVPTYHDLDDHERRECIQSLVRSDRVRTYRVPNNHTGTLWIKLYSVEEKESDTIIRQTAPVGENALAAAFKDAQDKAPMPELKPAPPVLNPQDFGSINESDAQPVSDVPVSIPAAPLPPVNSTDLRMQIAQLTAMAMQLEQKEENENLRATLEPLRDAVVNEYANVQAALTLQIDAVVAMGVAVERFNQALGGK